MLVFVKKRWDFKNSCWCWLCVSFFVWFWCLLRKKKKRDFKNLCWYWLCVLLCDTIETYFLLFCLAVTLAEEEPKMASFLDEINAYSYMYPVELPSDNFTFKWYANYIYVLFRVKCVSSRPSSFDQNWFWSLYLKRVFLLVVFCEILGVGCFWVVHNCYGSRDEIHNILEIQWLKAFINCRDKNKFW